MPCQYYETIADTLLDEIEMWFIANCSPDSYATIEQYIEDMDSFIDCINDTGLNDCINYLITEYGYSPEYIENHINEIAAYIVYCAENSLKENIK